jgi:molecular chaperone GrpE
MTRKKPHGEDPSGAEGGSATESEVASAESAAPANPFEEETARLRAREEELLRALAEMTNVQKRRRQETETALRYASESLVRDLLPVLDDLDRALASSTGGPGDLDSALRAGVTLVRDRLVHVLRQEGLSPIASKGTPFDPTLHDAIAVAVAPPGVAPGTVLEEASPGYRFQERVLRHAKVVVAEGPASPAGGETA